jgi:hypothetical protein
MLLPGAVLDVNGAFAELGIREGCVPAELWQAGRFAHLVHDPLNPAGETDHHPVVLGRVPEVPGPAVDVSGRYGVAAHCAAPSAGRIALHQPQ